MGSTSLRIYAERCKSYTSRFLQLAGRLGIAGDVVSDNPVSLFYDKFLPMQCTIFAGITRRNVTIVDASSDGGGKAWLVGCGPGDVELLTVSSLLTIARYPLCIRVSFSVGLYVQQILLTCPVLSLIRIQEM